MGSAGTKGFRGQFRRGFKTRDHPVCQMFSREGKILFFDARGVENYSAGWQLVDERRIVVALGS